MKLSRWMILAAAVSARSVGAHLDGVSGRDLQGNSGKQNGNGNGNGNGGNGNGNGGNGNGNGGNGNGNGNGGNGNSGGNGNGNGNGNNGGSAGGSAGEGGCPAETETCDNGGVRMCRVRNKGLVMNTCAQTAKKQQMLLDRGGFCGCCDFDAGVVDGVAVKGTCPTGECSAEDECNDGAGSYMCRQKGGSGKFKTMCVNKSQVARQQGRGAECGCCGGSCPTAGCSASANAVSCSKEDEDDGEDGEGIFEGYYMCRAINPKKGRYRTQCINDDQTLARQFRGDQCGCCGEDGTASSTCPSMCSGNMCTKEGDDGITTESGYYMCMKQGNKERTMCVGEEDVIKRQLQGMATCGCCEGGCPVA